MTTKRDRKNRWQNADEDICETTGKVSFKSEAKASRKIDKYNDIKRYYFCKDCGGYHLTKMRQ